MTELLSMIEAVSEFAGRAVLPTKCCSLRAPIRFGGLVIQRLDHGATHTIHGRYLNANPGGFNGHAVDLPAGPRLNFANARVKLVDLHPDSHVRCELMLEGEAGNDGDADPAADSTRLMTEFDRLILRHGKGTTQVASAGLVGERRLW